jgi:hypothetical protein
VVGPGIHAAQNNEIDSFLPASKINAPGRPDSWTSGLEALRPSTAYYFFFSSFFLWWSASPCTIPAQATQMVLGEGLPQMEHTDFFFGATDT